MNASSKVTLYDMLAMVIPGFLLLLLFYAGFGWQFEIPVGMNELVAGILMFIACYTVGLIYHKAVEYLYNKAGFRNNKANIQKALEKFQINEGKSGIDKKSVLPVYYQTYYRLMKHNMLNSIPVLEAQVAYIRNMLPLMALYIIALCSCRFDFWSVNSCALAIILFIVAVILAVLLGKIQGKIYELIWEGYKYMNSNKKNQIIKQ